MSMKHQNFKWRLLVRPAKHGCMYPARCQCLNALSNGFVCGIGACAAQETEGQTNGVAGATEGYGPSPSRPAVGVYGKRYEPGEVFKDCDECPEMVVIPSSSFRMGDLSGGGDNDEKPVYDVRFDYSFAVGKYEVTQEEWCADMGSNPTGFLGDRNPVEKGAPAPSILPVRPELHFRAWAGAVLVIAADEFLSGRLATLGAVFFDDLGRMEFTQSALSNNTSNGTIVCCYA